MANIWRNPKRTLVILTAVIIGAWTMLAFSALSRGIMTSMLSNALNTLTGHIQIQTRAFRDDPVVENRIEDPAPLTKILEKSLPGGIRWTFRIQVPGVASNAGNSEGITIVGIDPDQEPHFSFYGDTTTEGRLLSSEDPRGIVVGQALVDSFGTRVGRKLVLMTQGKDGKTASRAFKIRGVFRAQMKATEKQYVFITLAAAQKLLGIDTAVTNVCIKLADPDPLDDVTRALAQSLPENLAVLGWPELLPLLNLMGGLDYPSKGRIILKEEDITGFSQYRLAQLRLNNIGFVFQSYNIIPVLSARENVEYVMLLQGVPAKQRKDSARAILDEVGLENMYDRRPAELSGGQQQRVAVARAIVSRPAIVLADEPTANLDSKTGRGLLEMMKTMNRKHGTTFIFSTHDQMVMEYAARIVHLKDGLVVQDSA